MVGPPAPNLFRQSLRQTILEPISRLHSRTSSATSSRRSVACPACVRPPDLAHRRLQEEEETARPLPEAVPAPVQAKPAKPARCIPLPQVKSSMICACIILCVLSFLPCHHALATSQLTDMRIPQKSLRSGGGTPLQVLAVLSCMYLHCY